MTSYIVAGIIGLLIFLIGRSMAVKSFLAGRKNLVDAELARSFSGAGIRSERFTLKILPEIGKCYFVPYGMLRQRIVSKAAWQRLIRIGVDAELEICSEFLALNLV